MTHPRLIFARLLAGLATTLLEIYESKHINYILYELHNFIKFGLQSKTIFYKTELTNPDFLLYFHLFYHKSRGTGQLIQLLSENQSSCPS